SAGGTGSASAKLRSLTADLADVLARLNTDLPTRASEQTLVQARDALSALAGTVDAGAREVTLSGRIVECTMADQVEIRDTNSYDFTIPPEVIGDWVDFELYITDTHPLPDSDRIRPKMFFAIGGSVASSNDHITVMGKTRSYAWRPQ